MNNKNNIKNVFKLLGLSSKEERDSVLNTSLKHLEQKKDSLNYFILTTSTSLGEKKENA